MMQDFLRHSTMNKKFKNNQQHINQQMISLRQIFIDKYLIVSSKSGFAHKVDLKPWMLLILLQKLGVQVLSLVLNKVIIYFTSLKSKLTICTCLESLLYLKNE